MARPWAGVGAALSVLLVGGGVARADWVSSLEAPFRDALTSGSSTVALGTVFLAGVATSLTPCVYPMIAITVSVFGATEAKSKTHGAALSLAYVLGMAALFTPLGILAAVTGGVFGSLLANPFVIAGLALVFVAMALSMFGAFDLALPASLQNRLAQMGGVGWKGAFVLGFVSGLIAAPCTGPVLAVLLTWISTTGRVAFGGLALFVYSLGLGVLVFVVGTFAVSLPKSGAWLEAVKSAFGAVMLTVAVYFARDLLPLPRPVERETWLLGAAGGAFVVGLLFGAIHRSFHDPSTSVRVRKAVGLVFLVGAATAAILWAQALPPGAKIAWLDDYDRARAVAAAEQRPLLVDFGASWCGACGELDRETFSDPRVVSEAVRRNVVAVRVDLSPGKDSAENRAALASYGHKGLPLVVLHEPGGKEASRVTAFMDAEAFLEVLDRLD